MSTKIKNKILIVDDSEAQQRLDLYLYSKKAGASRSSLQKKISKQHILVNQKKSKSSYLVQSGDQIEILNLSSEIPETLKQKNISVPIVFEDQDLIVVNKPSGLVTHPGAGNESESLVHAFFDSLYQNSKVRPGVVHRLDKETQGLLVLAKNKAAYENLALQFKNKTATRIYRALCFGSPKEKSGRIESFLARHPKNRKKFSSQKEGRLAVTNYKVLTPGPLSLVELALETGRTHQIRVHLSELGHPILNDAVYGSLKRINGLTLPELKARAKRISHLALAAVELHLIHPRTQKTMEFKIDWPAEFDIL